MTYSKQVLKLMEARNRSDDFLAKIRKRSESMCLRALAKRDRANEAVNNRIDLEKTVAVAKRHGLSVDPVRRVIGLVNKLRYYNNPHGQADELIGIVLSELCKRKST